MLKLGLCKRSAEVKKFRTAMSPLSQSEASMSPPKYEFNSGLVHVGFMAEKKWHSDRFLSEYFGLPC